MSYSSFPTGAIGGVDPLVGSPESPMLRPHVQPITAITKPSPIEYVDTRYYVCTVANASFHRFDGTRIAFRFGFFESNIKATIEYLDFEIQQGNQYLRVATSDEVHEAKMRFDPVGTIREKVKEEVEAELRVKLEAEIREKMGILSGLNTSPLQTDVQRSAADADKLAGLDAKERLSKIQDVRNAEGAKVIINPAGGNKLGGVVSTADIKSAAKG